MQRIALDTTSSFKALEPHPHLTMNVLTLCHLTPHPLVQRIALDTTSSFKALDPHWREELQRLHNDYYHHRQVGAVGVVWGGVGCLGVRLQGEGGAGGVFMNQ